VFVSQEEYSHRCGRLIGLLIGWSVPSYIYVHRRSHLYNKHATRKVPIEICLFAQIICLKSNGFHQTVLLSRRSYSPCKWTDVSIRNWSVSWTAVIVVFSSLPSIAPQPLLAAEPPFSSVFCSSAATSFLLGCVMCPSGRRPPILFLVFPLVWCYEMSHSEPFLGSSRLPLF
jgi:hypothetical protein